MSEPTPHQKWLGEFMRLVDEYAVADGCTITTAGSELCAFLDKMPELATLRAQLAAVTAERDQLAWMLAAWCVAVEDNGSGWDDWDERYKDAAYRGEGPIRELIDATMKEIRGPYAALDAALAKQEGQRAE